MAKSADSDDTRSPVPPQASAPEKDARRSRTADYVKPTRSLTESEKRREELRIAKKGRLAKAREASLTANRAMKALAKIQREQDIDENAKLVDAIANRGLKLAMGLFEQPTAEGYNADATVPLPDATTRTHFAMTVYKQMMAKQREGMATQRALGVIMVQGRMNEVDWNAQAHQVDEDQRLQQSLAVAEELLKKEEP
jgi:hypothetical protein